MSIKNSKKSILKKSILSLKNSWFEELNSLLLLRDKNNNDFKLFEQQKFLLKNHDYISEKINEEQLQKIITNYYFSSKKEFNKLFITSFIFQLQSELNMSLNEQNFFLNWYLNDEK